MKWKAKEFVLSVERDVCFAWFPVRCEDNYWRWLEKVRYREEYSSGEWGPGPGSNWYFYPLEKRARK